MNKDILLIAEEARLLQQTSFYFEPPLLVTSSSHAGLKIWSTFLSYLNSRLLSRDSEGALRALQKKAFTVTICIGLQLPVGRERTFLYIFPSNNLFQSSVIHRQSINPSHKEFALSLYLNLIS